MVGLSVLLANCTGADFAVYPASKSDRGRFGCLSDSLVQKSIESARSVCSPAGTGGSADEQSVQNKSYFFDSSCQSFGTLR